METLTDLFYRHIVFSSMEFKLLLAGIILFIAARLMKPHVEKIASPRGSKVYREIYEWIETGWSAVLLAAFLMFFFIQAFKIPSGSMRMTLLEGDHLFVNKFVYGLHVPFSGGKRILPLRKVRRGDIIIFPCPPEGLSALEREKGVKKDFIKRAVALGGDVVEVKNKKLFVNGKPADEPYAQFVDDYVYPRVDIFASREEYQRAWEKGQFAALSPDMVRDNFGPVIVPTGHYLAMGDNRDRSFDSRFWGPVPDPALKGKALVIYWPLPRLRAIR